MSSLSRENVPNIGWQNNQVSVAVTADNADGKFDAIVFMSIDSIGASIGVSLSADGAARMADALLKAAQVAAQSNNKKEKAA